MTIRETLTFAVVIGTIAGCSLAAVVLAETGIGRAEYLTSIVVITLLGISIMLGWARLVVGSL